MLLGPQNKEVILLTCVECVWTGRGKEIIIIRILSSKNTSLSVYVCICKPSCAQIMHFGLRALIGGLEAPRSIYSLHQAHPRTGLLHRFRAQLA